MPYAHQIQTRRLETPFGYSVENGAVFDLTSTELKTLQCCSAYWLARVADLRSASATEGLSRHTGIARVVLQAEILRAPATDMPIGVTHTNIPVLRNIITSNPDGTNLVQFVNEADRLLAGMAKGETGKMVVPAEHRRSLRLNLTNYLEEQARAGINAAIELASTPLSDRGVYEYRRPIAHAAAVVRSAGVALDHSCEFFDKSMLLQSETEFGLQHSIPNVPGRMVTDEGYDALIAGLQAARKSVEETPINFDAIDPHSAAQTADLEALFTMPAFGENVAD